MVYFTPARSHSDLDVADPQYNRVLVKRPGLYRTFRSPTGETAGRYDAQSFQYLIEEFVALSAVEMAVTATSPALSSIDDLPAVFRDQIKVVDRNGRERAETAAFLKPCCQEFGLAFRADGAFQLPQDLPPGLRLAIGRLIPGVYDFLLAANHRLQADINLPELKDAVEGMKAASSDPDARAHLSTFLGVLNSYQPVTIPSAELVTTAPFEHQTRFKELIEDLAYRNLSENAALLGMPADAARAIQLMERWLRKLSSKRAFARTIKATSKVIFGSRGINGPDLDLAGLFVPRGYYPPLVAFDDALSRAEALWRKMRRPASEDPAFADVLNAGWVEIPGDQPSMDDFQGKPEGAVRDKFMIQ
jgi:hypothetical protein